MKCSPLLSTSDLPFPCKHMLHDTCQALLIQFPCPYPKERRALVMINTLTVMINKDRWACEAWLVFVITASVDIQLLLMKGWQGSPPCWQKTIYADSLAWPAADSGLFFPLTIAVHSIRGSVMAFRVPYTRETDLVEWTAIVRGKKRPLSAAGHARESA